MESESIDQDHDARAVSPSGAALVLLTDEQALVQRVRTGDRAAFANIFSTYGAPLCVYAHRFTRSVAAAEEIVQDVFVRIWEGRAQWEVTSVGAYLYAAVRRRALNHLRHEAVVDAWEQTTGAEPSVVDSPEDQMMQRELADAVQGALARLNPRLREAYLLHRQHRLTYAEIGTMLGVTPKAVEGRVSRALKALRLLLAGYLGIAIAIHL